jgi:hypothetical protein
MAAGPGGLILAHTQARRPSTGELHRLAAAMDGLSTNEVVDAMPTHRRERIRATGDGTLVLAVRVEAADDTREQHPRLIHTAGGCEYLLWRRPA